MKKRLLAGVLSAGLLLQAAVAATFTDVGSEYDWAQEAISNLAEKGVILGVTDTTYEPESNVTRDQLAALTVRALEITGEVPDEATFNDVPKDMWSFEAVELAKGLFGATSGAFEPEKAADRLTVATVLVGALQEKGLTQQETEEPVTFSDIADLSEEEQVIVQTAAEWGIVNGYPDGTFAPENNVTRAEVAVMVDRTLQIAQTAEPTPSSTPTATATASGEPTATPSATPTPTPTSSPTAASQSRGDFLVVTSVSSITGADGESASKVTGYLNGEEISVELKAEEVQDMSGIADNGNKIRVGDVITYVKDIKGEVVDCAIIFKAAAAVEDNQIVNPYHDEEMAVERNYSYFNTGYGLVRRVQSSSLELVYDDTVENSTVGKSDSYSIGKNANIYLYDVTGREPEVKLSDIGDISADKTVGDIPQSDEGNYVFVREVDDIVTDILILNGDFS